MYFKGLNFVSYIAIVAKSMLYLLLGYILVAWLWN